MALVTYILLAALHSGLQSRFHPEILGVTASTAIVVVLLDFAFVKFGCYILNIQVWPLVALDYLLAYPTLFRAQIKCWTCWRMTGTSSLGELHSLLSPNTTLTV